MHPSCILLNCACCSSLLSESAGAARRRATSRHRAAVRYAVLRFCLLVRRRTRVRGGATLRQARGRPHRASGTREQRATQSTSATERPRAGLTRSNSRKSCEGSIQAPQSCEGPLMPVWTRVHTGAPPGVHTGAADRRRQTGGAHRRSRPSPGDDVYGPLTPSRSLIDDERPAALHPRPCSAAAQHAAAAPCHPRRSKEQSEQQQQDAITSGGGCVPRAQHCCVFVTQQAHACATCASGAPTSVHAARRAWR